MLTAIEQEDVLRFPRFYAETELSNPGVVVDPEPSRSTTNTAEAPLQVTPWESRAFLDSCTQWFNSILRSLDNVTGNQHRVTFAKAQSRSAEAESEDISQSPTYQDQIAVVRSALSLQIKELAEVLDVKRPTIYSWINAENSPHPANRERLRQIFRLAQHWTRLSNTPLGDAMHAIDEHGTSIFDLLKKPSIPTGSIITRFRSLGSAQHVQPRTSPTSVRELARKHGIDLTQIDDRQDDIDLETGKPFSTD